MIERYAEINGDTLIKYPYLFSDLQNDNPHTNYGDNYDVAFWYPFTEKAKNTGNRLVLVSSLPEPTFDSFTQNCVLNNTPVLNNGEWSVDWVVSQKTQKEIADKIELWRNAAVCSPFQGRMALVNASLMTQVEAIIADAATPQETKIAWEYALEWRRMSPMIVTLGATLNLTDSQIDDLFKDAQTIVA